MPKPIPPEIVDRVRKLAGKGLTSSQIGTIIGKKPKQVQQMYRKHSIQCLPRGAQPGNQNNAAVHLFDLQEASRMYQSGKTYKAIADYFSIGGYKPEETVRRRLKRFGVASRVGGISGEKNSQWKGGIHNQNERARNRYECYRVVVAFLGQLLPMGWVVHHRDGNPTNNSLSNLLLFPSGTAHARHHQWLLKNRVASTSNEATRKALRIGGQLLQQPQCRTSDGPDKGLLDLLNKESERVGSRTKWKFLADAKYQPRVALPA